jgi:hypoxanthine phosphoribosyltransferase
VVGVVGFLLGVLASLIASVVFALVTRLPRLRRRVPFRRVVADVVRLSNAIAADPSFRPQAVVAVNRSGAVAGGILCGLLHGLEIGAPLVLPTRNERVAGVRSTTVEGDGPSLSGLQAVLVLSCVNDSGVGMKVAYDWTTMRAPAASVRTECVYSNAKAVVHPDYVARVVSSKDVDSILTRMAWMPPGWRHDLAGERHETSNSTL